jgi:hypothetical protein
MKTDYLCAKALADKNEVDKELEDRSLPSQRDGTKRKLRVDFKNF